MKGIFDYQFIFFGILVTIVVTASNIVKKESSNGVCTTDGCNRAAQRIKQYIDTSVKPCDNFYKFACGGFINSTTIPSDKPGVTPYTLINDVLQDRLKSLFEEDPQPNEIKPFLSLKMFYKSCLDTKAKEAGGLESTKGLFKQLGGWPVLDGEKWKENYFDWKKITYNLRSLGMYHDSLLVSGVDNHLKNATIGMIMFDQAELGVYQEVLLQGLNNTVVQAYYKLMTNIAIIFGAEQAFAEKEMLDALNLEISIAKISVPAEKLRDINLLFNPMTLNEMQERYPSVPWVELSNKLFGFEGQAIDGTEKVNVQQLRFITDLIELLQKTPKRVQANYVIWRAVKSISPYHTEQILQEYLKFEKQRTGVTARRQHWEECVTLVNSKLPTLAGAMYIRKHFTPEAREKVLEIVHSIKKAFNTILKEIDWMDEATKRHALLKLKNMLTHAAYSDELRDDNILGDYFSGLHVNSGDFLKQGLQINLFRTQKSNERLRQIIQRGDWRTRSTPAVINAYYNPTENIIEFPAGILQDVYFDENRPMYINFGGIGFLIGHEITHGFDDQGRQFDENGNLVDWWDKETNEAFVKKAQCIIEQYSNFTVAEIGIKINGITSQGENIADNGGIKESYLAYQNWVTQHSPEPMLPGLSYTPNQLFWISAANIWCSNYNSEFTRLLVLTNAHCPNDFRVIGAVQNMEHFANDFGCPLGSPMNPIQKCTVW